MVDLEAALKRVGNDRKCFGQLVDYFLEDYSGLVSRLREAIRKGDGPAVALTAYRLKRLVANFDLPDIVELAEVVERAGNERDLATAGASVDLLDVQIARLQEALAEFHHD